MLAVAIEAVLPGVVLFMLGFATLMAVVFASGGVAKSKQVGVVSDVLAGRQGPNKKRIFVVGLVMTLLGTCASFSGVLASDAKRRSACIEMCEAKGYAGGKIQASEPRDRPGSGKHTFVACACSDGPDPDPFEMRADELPE